MIMNRLSGWVKQDAPPRPAPAVPPRGVRTFRGQPVTGEVTMSSTSHSPSTRCIDSVTWSL